mgnify:CR=1 FL=1
MLGGFSGFGWHALTAHNTAKIWQRIAAELTAKPPPPRIDNLTAFGYLPAVHRALLVVALPVTVALACGDSSSEGSASDSASQPSAASAESSTGTSPTVPTTGHGDPTTTSASATEPAETGVGPTSASASTTDASDDTTSTSDPSTTAVSASTTSDDTTSTADDTTGAPCPEGSQGCPCGPDNACDRGLECQADLCLPIDCPEGTQGCPCGPGDACDMGLTCQAGLCADLPVCGDGVVEGNEACDLGNQNSNTGSCKLDCTKQTCGDGYVGPGEACDLGNQNSNTGTCKLDCSKQVCGDGYVGPGEACDDGNQSNGDGCESNCTQTPQGGDNCGNPGDGLWIEIDYDDAFTPTNPDWAYGGWTESQWAPQGQNWPYINALGGITIHEDQGVIGTTALLNGTNKELRVFIGLEGLVTYDYVTACVEGRSYSVGSSVQFRVENALNDCGGQAMMSNDWFSLHPTTVDVGDNCFIPGNDFQAIAIRPVGGSGALSLKRMRVTFHGAVY